MCIKSSAKKTKSLGASLPTHPPQSLLSTPPSAILHPLGIPLTWAVACCSDSGPWTWDSAPQRPSGACRSASGLRTACRRCRRASGEEREDGHMEHGKAQSPAAPYLGGSHTQCPTSRGIPGRPALSRSPKGRTCGFWSCWPFYT